MRKILPSICVILLLTSCILGLLYFTSLYDEYDEVNIPEIQQNKTSLRSSVESGVITSTITSKGSVISDSPDIYIENISVDFNNKSDSKYFSTACKIGDILKKGDLLYEYKGKKVKTNYDCKIVNMVVSDKSAQLSLLNYDNLFIVTSVDFDKLNLLDFNTKTILKLTTKDETKTYNGKIVNFGYEIKDGKIDVQIRSDEKLLPGTPLEVNFEITHQTESLYILKQMLLMDGNTYYVEVENEEGKRTHREVEIGDFFYEYSDNQKIEYVEIKNGLKLGEHLIVDIIE